MAVDQSLQGSLGKDFRGALPVTPFPLYVDVKVLGATNEDVTAPAGSSYVIISSDSALWVKRGGTAVVPVADAADGTGPVYLPANAVRAFAISGGSTLGFIAPGGSGKLSLEWYVR